MVAIQGQNIQGQKVHTKSTKQRKTKRQTIKKNIDHRARKEKRLISSVT
jgi:hypothetical protein